MAIWPVDVAIFLPARTSHGSKHGFLPAFGYSLRYRKSVRGVKILCAASEGKMRMFIDQFIDNEIKGNDVVLFSEFVGGCEIIREMFPSGELQSLLWDKDVAMNAPASARDFAFLQPRGAGLERVSLLRKRNGALGGRLDSALC